MASNAKKAGTAAKAEPTESKLKAARRAKLAMHLGAKAALLIAEFGGHFGDLDVAAHPQQTHLEAVPTLQGTRHPTAYRMLYLRLVHLFARLLSLTPPWMQDSIPGGCG
ncbi:MAG: hypothetical protein M3495_07300 [Pseudomonadota bacterium]|nr:hypothetical protein [Gammaproteobacteria bacterium]MDQ3581421.1 hypothetical protein [Pseudomonadota bacterium]